MSARRRRSVTGDKFTWEFGIPVNDISAMMTVEDTAELLITAEVNAEVRKVGACKLKSTNIITGCNIWGSHSNGYEECRLLGYKNQVHTSQETHYISTTESSWIMLCDYEEEEEEEEER
jgi:hypothetical protein